jgi:hypothetical protein
VLGGRPIIYDYKDFAPELTSSLDVRNFPFDDQELQVIFTSGTWEKDNIHFLFTSDADKPGHVHVHPDVHRHTEWLFLVRCADALID